MDPVFLLIILSKQNSFKKFKINISGCDSEVGEGEGVGAVKVTV